MELFSYEFGYAWPWNYGHLVAVILFGVAAGIAWWRQWPKWIHIISILMVTWGVIGFLVVQSAMRINLPLRLPTGQFLASGSGRVLDAGAGSGRSSLMVLLGRPDSHVVALDLYDGCCGIPDNTPERLFANARIAAVDERLEVQRGDVRDIPMQDNSVDAAVSAYVIDHLSKEGIKQSLAEIRRVLRPQGEFLLMVINNDMWVRIAYPFLLHHGYFGPRSNPEIWIDHLTDAGFEYIEHGTSPATLYFLVRK